MISGQRRACQELPQSHLGVIKPNQNESQLTSPLTSCLSGIEIVQLQVRYQVLVHVRVVRANDSTVDIVCGSEIENVSCVISIRNNLATVTNTSQMLSWGMLSCGGRLAIMSSPVGKTITLKCHSHRGHFLMFSSQCQCQCFLSSCRVICAICDEIQ